MTLVSGLTNQRHTDLSRQDQQRFMPFVSGLTNQMHSDLSRQDQQVEVNKTRIWLVKVLLKKRY